MERSRHSIRETARPRRSGRHLVFDSGSDFIDVALQEIHRLIKPRLVREKAKVEAYETIDDYTGAIVVRRDNGGFCEYLFKLEGKDEAASPISGGNRKVIACRLNGNFQVGYRERGGRTAWIEFDDYDEGAPPENFRGTRIEAERAKGIAASAADRIMQDMLMWR